MSNHEREDIHFDDGGPRDFDPGKLADGEHALWTSPEGVRLLAEVRGGKIRRWLGRDAEGREVPVTLKRRRVSAAGDPIAQAEDVPFPTSRPDLIIERCYACFPNPLPTGSRLLCYQVPCS